MYTFPQNGYIKILKISLLNDNFKLEAGSGKKAASYGCHTN